MKQRYSYLLAIIAVVFLAICPTQVLAQAKVGTTGELLFLKFQLSARSLGMGAVGITMIDEFAPVYSPGALALYYSDNRATVFTLLNPDLPRPLSLKTYGVGARALSIPIQNGGSTMTLALAYTHVGLESGPFEERTYEQGPVSDSRVFYVNEGADIYSIGFALQGAIDFGVGLNYKRLEQNYHDYGASGSCIDYSGLFRFQLDLSPSSVNHQYHLTQSIAAGWFNQGGDLRLLQTVSPLPRLFKFGMSHKFEFGSQGQSIFSVEMVNEIMSPKDSEGSFTHHGLELSLAEALLLRAGSGSGQGTDWSTWGFGLNLGGLLQTLSLIKVGQSGEGTLGWLAEHVDLTYDYGYGDWDIAPNLYFQKISLTIK